MVSAWAVTPRRLIVPLTTVITIVKIPEVLASPQLGLSGGPTNTLNI